MLARSVLLEGEEAGNVSPIRTFRIISVATGGYPETKRKPQREKERERERESVCVPFRRVVDAVKRMREK